MPSNNQLLSAIEGLPPEARQAMSAIFGAFVTELNQTTAWNTGSRSGSSSLAGSTERTTRGGTKAQHAEAGHEGGIVTAQRRKRGPNKKTFNQSQ